MASHHRKENPFSIFYECTSLKEVPVSLFDKNYKIENFRYAFYNCTSIEGVTPNTNGIELWQRSSYPQYPSNLK
ncbi:MAG: hypothetical protein LIP06_03595 [Tannerellaceae bacterium]|nr:hypothetical protein [Tannerellaceae bacterium]